MANTTDPTPCIQHVLPDAFAMATQVASPIEPMITFYTGYQCNVETASVPSFPSQTVVIDCEEDSDTDFPSPTGSCLRIMDEDPVLANTKVPHDKVNYLASHDKNGNILKKGYALLSMYVPPQFRVIFFGKDPSTTEPDDQDDVMVTIPPNTLYTDMCSQGPTLNNGESFLEKADTSVDCPDPSATDSDSPEVKNLTHRTPYFVVVRLKHWSDVLIDVCTRNAAVSVGAPQFQLRNIYKPETAGCDNLMKTICKSNQLSKQNKDICDCYIQQKLLDKKYGPHLRVPVCCFGTDPGGNINKNCAYNSAAYKSFNMMRSCCTFAQCQTVVQNNKKMQEAAADEGQIQCSGNFVNFPPPATSGSSDADSDVTLPSTTITHSFFPHWIWYMMVGTILLIIAFISTLAFV